MSLRPGHPLWAYDGQLAAWKAQGWTRVQMRDHLRAEHGLVCGVDSIKAVLEVMPENQVPHPSDPIGATLEMGGDAANAILAVQAIAKKKADKANKGRIMVEPDKKSDLKGRKYHPCGNLVVIAERSSKNQKAGEVVPCKCLLCGPRQARMDLWANWCQEHHCGTYKCIGVGDVVGCDAIRFCAGPKNDELICRECFGLPPVVKTLIDPERKIVRQT